MLYGPPCSASGMAVSKSTKPCDASHRIRAEKTHAAPDACLQRGGRRGRQAGTQQAHDVVEQEEAGGRPLGDHDPALHGVHVRLAHPRQHAAQRGQQVHGVQRVHEPHVRRPLVLAAQRQSGRACEAHERIPAGRPSGWPRQKRAPRCPPGPPPLCAGAWPAAPATARPACRAAFWRGRAPQPREQPRRRAARPSRCPRALRRRHARARARLRRSPPPVALRATWMPQAWRRGARTALRGARALCVSPRAHGSAAAARARTAAQRGQRLRQHHPAELQAQARPGGVAEVRRGRHRAGVQRKRPLNVVHGGRRSSRGARRSALGGMCAMRLLPLPPGALLARPGPDRALCASGGLQQA